MELKKDFAESIMNDMVIDNGDNAQCLACNSFGDYPDNVKHTSVCIVLKAKSFLREINGE